jgi:hypothetical protein
LDRQEEQEQLILEAVEALVETVPEEVEPVAPEL